MRTWPQTSVRGASALLLIFTGVATSQLVGDELRGRVTAAGTGTAKVELEGKLLPNEGDAATIYFKVDGVDDEVFVASGKVARVEQDGVVLSIARTDGTISGGQLARITSANPHGLEASTAEVAAFFLGVIVVLTIVVVVIIVSVNYVTRSRQRSAAARG